MGHTMTFGIPTESDLELGVLDLLRDAGWQTAFGPDIDPESDAPARTDFRETVLRGRLAAAIHTLNPTLDAAERDEALRVALAAESQSAMQENWRAYRLLIEGVPVETRDAAGAPRTVRAQLVDWEHPERNDFLAVQQFTVQGPKRLRRPDIVLFVNGLPFVLFELKRAGVEGATLHGAHNQIGTYVRDIPELFTWNQVCVISDGVNARAGQFTGGWNHFAPWKTITGTLAPASLPQVEVLVPGMCDPARLLELVRHFTVFRQDAGKLTRFVAKYHQFWAVNKAVFSTIEAVEGDGRAGVVWHTQGSGKSYEMLWYAGRIMRDPAMENPTLVVLTDRNDLDDQLFDDTFASSLPGAPLPESPVQVESRAQLKELLGGRQSGGIFFSTIQKFGLSQAEKHAGTAFPELSARTNIVVMVDEAHRSNYDFIDGFARHLRDGLPNATFIGFTGTPIESSDKSTKNVFGDYIDVYDLTQAVDDGATVKVYYEPRLARVELPPDVLDDLDDSFADAVSAAEEATQEKLKSKWARVEAIIGSENRLKELAADLVQHWEARREASPHAKAMVVTMSRRIAATLYEEIATLRPDWATDDDETGKMKVVITGSAADDPLIQQHVRAKDGRRRLKDRAKDPQDELELVIVRDMWLTGFDSPAMNTMYVDKPMRGANLMQAIARVNRTFQGKDGGLVVDYIGIAEDLKSALADYTQRDRDNQEIGEDVREQAIPELLATHDVVATLLHGYDWRGVLASGTPLAFVKALSGAMEHLLAGSRGQETGRTLKDRYLAEAGKFVRLYALCAGSDEAEALKADAAFFEAVRAQLRKLETGDRRVDPNAEAETAVRQLVSNAMTGAGVIDIYEQAGIERPDLSLIDDDFIERFTQSEHKNLQLEALKRLLSGEIARVAQRNVVKSREFSEMLSESILKYQNRALDSAQVMLALAELTQRVLAEAHRAQELGISEDELAFYDAIRTNDAAVLELGDDTLRAIAHDLVGIMRRDAKTDWRVKEQVRAKLRTSIKRLLRRHGYPPDRSEEAIVTVLRQVEALAA